MKAIVFAVLMLVSLDAPAWAQKPCDQFKANVTSAPVVTPVERVPAIAGKRIYLCGYIIMPQGTGQAVDFQLTTGTGTNCGTNTTILIPRMSVPANGIVNRIGTAAGETSPIGGAVCLQTWGNGAVTSIFYWAQF